MTRTPPSHGWPETNRQRPVQGRRRWALGKKSRDGGVAGRQDGGGAGQAPVKVGLSLARKASTAVLWSVLFPVRSMYSPSRASDSVSGWPAL